MMEELANAERRILRKILGPIKEGDQYRRRHNNELYKHIEFWSLRRVVAEQGRCQPLLRAQTKTQGLMDASLGTRVLLKD